MKNINIAATALAILLTLTFSLGAAIQTTPYPQAYAINQGAQGPQVVFSETQLNKIGHQIWEFQSHSDPMAITTWSHYSNPIEDYASIGIGENIWYTQQTPTRFQEDWPAMAEFLKDRGYPIQDWMLGYCPWNNQEEFNDALQNDPRLAELRDMLSTEEAITDQAAWSVERFNQSYPKIINAIEDDAMQAVVDQRYHLLLQTPESCFAMIDYVHYKGEGTLSTERALGEGWGLLQVLEGMDDQEIATKGVLNAFINSAHRVLYRLYQNLNQERGEAGQETRDRNLHVWYNRIESYKDIDFNSPSPFLINQ